MHFIALVASCFGIYLVYRLACLITNIDDAIIATVLFASTEFFLFFSKSGLSDAVFLCFFLASILYFFRGIKENKDICFLFAGLFLILALYTKYSAFPLLISFLTVGMLHKKKINQKWFAYSLVLPAILYAPYIYVLLKYIGTGELSSRHFNFLGLNHLKFIVFLLLFAPATLFLSLTQLLRSMKKLSIWNTYLFIVIIIFFVILGFYYPYFRLAYPLVSLLAIPGAQFINSLGKRRILIISLFVLISLGFGFRTIKYYSQVPKNTGIFVRELAEVKDIDYIYAVVPPNILFYINYEIVVPEGHPWERFGRLFPLFNKNKEIIHPDDVGLSVTGKTLLVHASALDEVKQEYSQLYEKGVKVSSFHFIDAPIYYKDIYNPQRDIRQFYEVYFIDNAKLGDQLNDLWLFGFDRRVTVMVR